MNKSELIDAVAASAGITKKDAGAAVEGVIGAVTKALKKGDKVSVPGFGTFSVSKRSAREGRNPSTGATIKIKAKKVAKFKAGKGLDDAIN